MNEQLTLNGVALDSHAVLTQSIAPLLRVPARRGDNAVVPARHGRIKLPRKPFDENEFVLPFWTVGCLPDGSIPSDSTARTEFFRRRREFLQLLYTDPLVLAYNPDADVFPWLQAEVEVADVLDFERVGIEPAAQVSVALSVPGAFWTEQADVSQTITGTTGTQAELTVFHGSTAPVADARITFFGPVSNPRLAVGERWVQFNGVIAAGRELVLDCGSWRPSSGAGAVWSPPVTQVYREPGPCWLEIPPSYTAPTATFTHTGGGSASVEVAGHRKFLAP